jgi:hypothetical protein
LRSGGAGNPGGKDKGQKSAPAIRRFHVPTFKSRAPCLEANRPN